MPDRYIDLHNQFGNLGFGAKDPRLAIFIEIQKRLSKPKISVLEIIRIYWTSYDKTLRISELVQTYAFQILMNLGFKCDDTNLPIYINAMHLLALQNQDTITKENVLSKAKTLGTNIVAQPREIKVVEG